MSGTAALPPPDTFRIEPSRASLPGMTLRLLLIRHAKSDQGSAPRDEDRPLSRRGRREAPRMGRWVAEGGFQPDEALCSAAARTRETLDLMRPAWTPAPLVSHRPELYAAGPDAMMAVLAEAEGATVAMVGHNPGVGLLAARLAGEAPRHPCWDDFPPAAVAVLGFEVEAWGGIGEGTGEVLAFAVPADVG